MILFVKQILFMNIKKHFFGLKASGDTRTVFLTNSIYIIYIMYIYIYVFYLWKRSYHRHDFMSLSQFSRLLHIESEAILPDLYRVHFTAIYCWTITTNSFSSDSEICKMSETLDCLKKLIRIYYVTSFTTVTLEISWTCLRIF